MQVFLPDDAPFSDVQRAWLNGFVAGLLGMERALSNAEAPAAIATASAIDETFPWHDPALALEERLQLATDRPLERKLMAAMGQLDCGQCGYQCQTYAEAIARRTETDLNKCAPGGRATMKKLKELMAQAGTAAPVAAVATPVAAPAERGYARELPVAARFSWSTALNQPDAEKETRHVAIDIADTGLAYEPGDALGVWPHNNPHEVELLLAILKAKGSEAVTVADGALISAREALTRECDLRLPTDALYQLLAHEATNAIERSRLLKLAQDDSQADTVGVHDVLDVLLEFPSARLRVSDFVVALARLQPRLYSIASSLQEHPGEVHLTVGVLRYEKNDRAYQGTASTFLAEHLQPGRPVSVYVQRTHGFRLPADPATPIIMIGAGTGIAPFRAFLQERAATAAPGRNWLLFGNQRRDIDFLYRRELEDMAERRVLSRMDLAFSRDQAAKVYVQHRMLEAAAELWRWLGNGAHVYVCGDAKRMAGDVDLALQQITMAQGGMDASTAKQYMTELARSGRYQRDVY